MDKLKEKIKDFKDGRRKSQPDGEGLGTTGGTGTIADNRDSIDSELAAMPPSERVAYLKEFDESDKNDAPRKGGLIEKLIARGNRKTEEQLEREAKEREAARAAALNTANDNVQSG